MRLWHWPSRRSGACLPVSASLRSLIRRHRRRPPPRRTGSPPRTGDSPCGPGWSGSQPRLVPPPGSGSRVRISPITGPGRPWSSSSSRAFYHGAARSLLAPWTAFATSTIVCLACRMQRARTASGARSVEKFRIQRAPSPRTARRSAPKNSLRPFTRSTGLTKGAGSLSVLWAATDSIAAQQLMDPSLRADRRSALRLSDGRMVDRPTPRERLGPRSPPYPPASRSGMPGRKDAAWKGESRKVGRIWTRLGARP